MPNWCFNRLEISLHNDAGKKLLEAFRDNHKNDKGEEFSSPFTDLSPTPVELLDTERSFGGEPEEQAKREARYAQNKEKYGYSDWYEWRLANWGTKWEACEVSIEHEDESTCLVRFDTAWCPPTNLLEWYAKKYPEVVFLNEYDEEGCGFEGYDMNSAHGFVSESWEPREAPMFQDLLDSIPETEK